MAFRDKCSHKAVAAQQIHRKDERLFSKNKCSHKTKENGSSTGEMACRDKCSHNEKENGSSTGEMNDGFGEI